MVSTPDLSSSMPPRNALTGRHYSVIFPTNFSPYIVGEPGFAHTLVFHNNHAQIALSLYSFPTQNSALEFSEQQTRAFAEKYTPNGDGSYSLSAESHARILYHYHGKVLARISAQYLPSYATSVNTALTTIVESLELHRDTTVTALAGEPLEITPLPTDSISTTRGEDNHG